MSRSDTSLNVAAVSRMSFISSVVMPLMSSRSFELNSINQPRTVIHELTRIFTNESLKFFGFRFLKFVSIRDNSWQISFTQNNHLLFNTVLSKRHFHLLPCRGWKVLSDKVGADRKFPMPPVQKHGELYAFRPAVVHDAVQGSPYRPAREEHIVNEHDHPVLYIKRNVRGLRHGLRLTRCQVVPVHGDIQTADRNINSFDLVYPGGQSLREMDTAPLYADDSKALRALVLLQDLMSDPGKCAFNSGLVQDQRFFLHRHNGNPIRLKKDTKKPSLEKSKEKVCTCV